ncbi:MAG: FtsX-like permease family protein [Gammaproteobacteria bacterium]|nr:FtsX-like permease family protein [Gammaproteobacteria bacterium]
MKFAFRQLLKNPGFTAVAVITLAVGIGVNAMVFALARAAFLTPLPVAHDGRSLWLRMANTQSGEREDLLSWLDREDILGSAKSIDSIALIGAPGATWKHDGRFEERPSLLLTPELEEILAVRPVLGRLIRPEDLDPAAPPVVLISHSFWQEHFGGAPSAIGQTLDLDETPRTIIGILPPGADFPINEILPTKSGWVPSNRAAFWLPLRVQPSDRVSRDARMFQAVARLKPGASRKAAAAELDWLSRRLSTDFPESNRYRHLDLVSFRDRILGRARTGLVLLAFAVAAVLLICCVNLSNLLLARSVARQHEFAVRLALGAGSRHLVRLLISEALVLSLAGGILGTAFAFALLGAVRPLVVEMVPFVRFASIDPLVLAFVLILSILTAALTSALPGWWQTRTQSRDSFNDGFRSTVPPRILRLQHGLLSGQIALVLVLLSAAVLLAESFRRLMTQDFGYNPESVLTLEISSPGFPSNGDVCRMYRRLHALIAALPGVQFAGTVSSAPLTAKWTFDEKANVLGHSLLEADRPSLAATFVAFDYFPAMGIRLLDGRFFRDSELNDDGYGQNILLNLSAANLLFPGRSAVGGRFTVGSNPDRVLQVIGVVNDTRDIRLEQAPLPRFYWQYPFGGAQVVVRSTTPPAALIPLLRNAAAQADSRIAITSIRPLNQIVAATVADRRFLILLLSAYGALALALAMVGIFAVASYQVARRTREFGVRLALGATPHHLSCLVLARVGRWSLLGLCLGVVASLAVNRLLRHQLFAVSPYNPFLLGAAGALLFVSALLAGLLPARHAAKVNPSEALRHE